MFLEVWYYKIRLEQVIVARISDVTDGSAPNNNQVELSATRVGWTYYFKKSDGSIEAPVKFGWDNAANTEWTGF